MCLRLILTPQDLQSEKKKELGTQVKMGVPARRRPGEQKRSRCIYSAETDSRRGGKPNLGRGAGRELVDESRVDIPGRKTEEKDHKTMKNSGAN